MAHSSSCEGEVGWAPGIGNAGTGHRPCKQAVRQQAEGSMAWDVKGKGGVTYPIHTGLCLETQASIIKSLHKHDQVGDTMVRSRIEDIIIARMGEMH
ncbi:hypothetical protein HaLaN_16044 [Haematococcus lacustris]|uniref:Uncharacterized protein n=1 Tax=Haematococcus lacustris TaxID=44745 RepID=A0A699ZAF2_HAELA|nr:hypothetical protein HaLaN_16044 [Haematococcus lacustris]